MIDYAEIQAEVQDLEAWKNTAQTLLIDLTKQVDRLEKIVAENKMVIEHQADVMQKLVFSFTDQEAVL